MNQTANFFAKVAAARSLLPETPSRPVLVYSRTETQGPGELAHHLRIAFKALLLVLANLRIAAGILYARAINSLRLAWVLAGFGWGGFLFSCVAFPLVFHFAR